MGMLLVILFCEFYCVLLEKIRQISDLVFSQSTKKDDINKELIINLENEYCATNIALKIKEYFDDKLKIKVGSFYAPKDFSNIEGDTLYIDLLSKAEKKGSFSLPKVLYNKILKQESYLPKSEFNKLLPKSINNQLIVPFIFSKKVFGLCVIEIDRSLESLAL